MLYQGYSNEYLLFLAKLFIHTVEDILDLSLLSSAVSYPKTRLPNRLIYQANRFSDQQLFRLASEFFRLAGYRKAPTTLKRAQISQATVVHLIRVISTCPRWPFPTGLLFFSPFSFFSSPSSIPSFCHNYPIFLLFSITFFLSNHKGDHASTLQ